MSTRFFTDEGHVLESAVLIQGTLPYNQDTDPLSNYIIPLLSTYTLQLFNSHLKYPR